MTLRDGDSESWMDISNYGGLLEKRMKVTDVYYNVVFSRKKDARLPKKGCGVKVYYLVGGILKDHSWFDPVVDARGCEKGELRNK